MTKQRFGIFVALALCAIVIVFAAREAFRHGSEGAAAAHDGPAVSATVAKDWSSKGHPVTPWTVETIHDKITQKDSYGAMVVYPKPLVALSVDCDGGDLGVTFSGGHMVPGSDGHYDVTYRFDQGPAVENETWHAAQFIATPPDQAAFLENMAHSRQLLIRIGSDGMMPLDLSYNMVGFDKALKTLRQHCPAPSKGA